MKKILGYLFIIIINYFLITFVVFSFSYISLINNKTYDLFWIKYIQKKLYFSGLRNLWNQNSQCSTFDEDLLYIPKPGKCEFNNPEFKTILNFDEDRRLNLIDDKIDENEKLIITVGDSLTMGWGVNDNETFSYNLQKLIKKKVINLGVSSYGTVREIKRLKKSKFFDQADVIIIQYHLNDIYENQDLNINKVYSENDYENLISKNNKLDKIKFIFRNYKKSLRLFFTNIKDLTIYRNNLENHNLNDHFKNLDKIISKYLIFEKKRIIVFLIKEPYQNFIFDKNRKFLNYEFFVININKTHTFKIDDHLNMSGHKFVGKKLYEYLN